MSSSDLIQSSHLQRLAVIYVRQSSPGQVINNQESTRLQYALKQRALEYGWHERDIIVIDTDLGITASNAVDRPGFQELVTMVSLGHVGIAFAYDATRLARNCTDWYQLLDLCGLRQCLVGDQESIYDPAAPNGRLIVWRGGLSTTADVRVPVRSFADLSDGQQINDTISRLARAGQTDEAIAVTLTANGHRTPTGRAIKASTVRVFRWNNRILCSPNKSRPRRKPGYLTIRQLADRLEVESSKIYHHILAGTISLKKDEDLKCYLFPDKLATLRQIRQLLDSRIDRVAF